MKGISFIEILICLAIISGVMIVSSLMGSLFQLKTIERIEADMRGIIHFAKSQSLLSGKDLELAPLSSNKNWAEGIGLYELTDSKHLIYQWSGYAGKVKISWLGFQSKNGIQFSSKLRENRANGYFTIAVQDKRRILVLNRLGRIK